MQAGGSPRGRAIRRAAADSIIAVANGIAGMKEYRDDVRGTRRRSGRNPDDIKVLFVVAPVLARPMRRHRPSPEDDRLAGYIERALAGISSITDIDFSKFDARRAAAAV